MNSCTSKNQKRFNIEFVSLDVNRKKGGTLKVLKRCRVASASHNIMQHGTVVVLPNRGVTEKTVHTRLIFKLNDEIITG